MQRTSRSLNLLLTKSPSTKLSDQKVCEQQTAHYFSCSTTLMDCAHTLGPLRENTD